MYLCKIHSSEAHTHITFASLIVCIYTNQNLQCVCVRVCVLQNKRLTQCWELPCDIRQKLPANRSLPLNNYPLCRSHIYTFLTKLLLSAAAPSPLLLPADDVDVWQLCLCTDRFFSLIRTLEVVIGHYTLFLGSPASPTPFPPTLWFSDRSAQEAEETLLSTWQNLRVWHKKRLKYTQQFVWHSKTIGGRKIVKKTTIMCSG